MTSTVLSGLEPAAVFHWFEQISAIPRGSGHTAAISQFCADFAAQRGLRCCRDRTNSVVLYKDASPGYEDHPTVILQGHLDMVWEKTADCDLEFRTQVLRLAVDGDQIYAQGTTLGGDNGIAIAYALALLDDPDAIHPPLEVLLTADEETDMAGAEALDPLLLRGRRMVNLDSEEEGVFTVSCAGGVTATIALPYDTAPAAGYLYRLRVTGLLGGHSGSDIDKGRANAILLLGQALRLLDHVTPLRVASLRGGGRDNVIPREAEALFVAPPDKERSLAAAAEAFAAELREAYPVETGLTITCTPDNTGVAEIWDRPSTQRFLRLLTEVPNGVQSRSRSMEGLVETSLNLGILRVAGDTVKLTFAIRSSLERDKRYLTAVLQGIAQQSNGLYSDLGDYPAWEYRETSPLRNIAVEVYRQQYGREPQVVSIHAGLECGVLSKKLPGLDCISLGPNLFDVHTPQERMSIASVARTWDYLRALLKAL